MTKKRLIIRLILFILIFSLILILVIPISPIHRIIRSYSIYLLSQSCPSNAGATFHYIPFRRPWVSMPWGIKRRDLKFLVSNRLLNIDDWRWSPVISEIIEETENSVSYIIIDPHWYPTVTFYFDSNGKYYKAVQYFKPNQSDLGAFLGFNRWFGKGLLVHAQLSEYYKDTHTYVIKWRCENYESGFAHYTYHFRGWPNTRPEFKSIDINSLRGGTTPLTEYPELEIYFKMEFEGMIIEHHLRPDPDDSSLFLREAVYTSTFLTGD